MPRRSDARQRMIESAAILFRERGIDGTSFAEVIEHSAAPRGSIYHHFRGGKSELAEATTTWAGEHILARTVAALADEDPIAAIERFRLWWTEILQTGDFAGGCVLAAAALEGDREPAVRDAAARAFASWEDVLANTLRRRGMADARARSVATLVIASIEGAVILCRATRTTEPLDRVIGELRELVTDAVSR